MCKQGHKIRFCTCSDLSATSMKKMFACELRELQKSDTYNLIKWKLNRFIKNEWIGLDGLLFKPTDKLTAQITSDFLQNEMNIMNCFDFNYIPKEGDNIIFKLERINKKGKKIKKQKDYKFISLIFKDEKWTIDSYDTFYNIIEEIKRGIVKY